jgi:hypothetical protein
MTCPRSAKDKQRAKNLAAVSRCALCLLDVAPQKTYYCLTATFGGGL